ncbi:hypothetical protein ENHY17A_50121 [Moraxellaceae bacterium 17A]|nr:hypothetical protein ENHY17A_50121 [Moraxellaceae bacterium 17A]
MTTKLTPQQKKTIRKVTEALKDSMISMTIDDLVNATGSSPAVIKNTLAKIEGVKQDENGYYLPRDDHELNAVAVNIQEAPVNMQDKELNTQAPQVSYHDNGEATLINPSAEVTNPSAKVVNPSDIDTDTDHDAIINEGVKQISILEEAKDAPYEKLTMPKKLRNKPFTPNPIMGYQVQKGKAKIFLDRRATSKTLTLSLDDLKELVNAVEKSERVA